MRIDEYDVAKTYCWGPQSAAVASKQALAEWFRLCIAKRCLESCNKHRATGNVMCMHFVCSSCFSA